MYRMLFFGYRRFYKGTVTQSCVPLACLWRCKIPGIAGRSQEKLKKKTCKILLEIFTSGDVTASWRRLKRVTESSSWRLTAFDLAKYPPSADNVVKDLTLLPRRALLADCMHKAFLLTCIGRSMVICTILWEKRRIWNLKLVNKYLKCFCFNKIR